MAGHEYSGTHSSRQGGERHRWPWRPLTERTGATLGAVAVGLASLSVYLLTLAPGLTWAHDSADGGALAAAAYTLGIPHPPGHPTYVLFGHLFTLLPIGEVATRTNIFSAFCAAGAAALLSWTLAQTAHSRATVVGAGLALASSPLLWSQATVTEVHALSALFTAVLLALGVVSEATAHRPAWQASLLALAVGGALGLGVGNHPTAVFSGPLAVFALWRLRRFRLAGLLGIALGLAIFTYLPLRAAADPPVNWGDPRTLGQFWWVVSGAPYRHYVFALDWAYVPTRLLAYTALVTRQFSVVGLVAAAVGLAILWRSNRALALATGATAALHTVFAIGYDTSDSYLYLTPVSVCLGFWLGSGVDWLIGATATRAPWANRLTIALAIILPLAATVVRFPAMDLGGDRGPSEFEAAVLAQAPPQAIILSQQDAHTFALWYFQHAQGHRPDVVVVDTGLLGYSWYDAQLAQRITPRQAVSSSVGALLAEGGGSSRRAAEIFGRPVCQIESDWAGLLCAEP